MNDFKEKKKRKMKADTKDALKLDKNTQVKSQYVFIRLFTFFFPFLFHFIGCV